MEASVILGDPVSAHAQLSALWPKIKPELAGGHRHILEVRPYEDKLSDQQRRYYHGYILKSIATQTQAAAARILGRTCSERVWFEHWKEYFRDKYLGTKRKSVLNPVTGRKSKRSVRVSTEDLGVRGYNKLIEQVTAEAVTELGVNFDLSLDEYIDQETGEILTRGAR